ncbi:hypothetical protein [Arthrobacter crystallopoietes]|uniref:hypothetical protein n=1 Tax=Crystallibacter crystallopoietes TaxID=37928 RepID=UPI000944C59C|nr:hypothetical protein [Arthrobacter crystallopoietes]AUI52894.1 hypothetical protein AC20117_20975 [Arthrobacter crystallopoietes]
MPPAAFSLRRILPLLAGLLFVMSCMLGTPASSSGHNVSGTPATHAGAATAAGQQQPPAPGNSSALSAAHETAVKTTAMPAAGTCSDSGHMFLADCVLTPAAAAPAGAPAPDLHWATPGYRFDVLPRAPGLITRLPRPPSLIQLSISRT